MVWASLPEEGNPTPKKLNLLFFCFFLGMCFSVVQPPRKALTLPGGCSRTSSSLRRGAVHVSWCGRPLEAHTASNHALGIL